MADSTTYFRVALHSLHGHSLAACDASGKSDPTIKVNFDNFKEWQSSVVKQDLNPVWPDSIEFVYETRQAAKLLGKTFVFDVLDVDYGLLGGTSTDPIGSVSIDLYNLALGPPAHVLSLKHRGADRGKLSFSCTFEQLSLCSMTVDSVDVELDRVAAAAAGEAPVTVSLTFEEADVSLKATSVDADNRWRSMSAETSTSTRVALAGLLRCALQIRVTAASGAIVAVAAAEMGRVLSPGGGGSTLDCDLMSADGARVVGAITATLHMKGMPTYAQMVAGTRSDDGITDGQYLAASLPQKPFVPVQTTRPPLLDFRAAGPLRRTYKPDAAPTAAAAASSAATPAPEPVVDRTPAAPAPPPAPAPAPIPAPAPVQLEPVPEPVPAAAPPPPRSASHAVIDAVHAEARMHVLQEHSAAAEAAAALPARMASMSMSAAPVAQPSYAPAPAPAHTPHTITIPWFWARAVDGTGKAFFSNHVTRRTVWELPTEARYSITFPYPGTLGLELESAFRLPSPTMVFPGERYPGGAYVKGCVPGSSSEAVGRIHAGHVLVALNDRVVTGVPFDGVVQMLATAGRPLVLHFDDPFAVPADVAAAAADARNTVVTAAAPVAAPAPAPYGAAPPGAYGGGYGAPAMSPAPAPSPYGAMPFASAAGPYGGGYGAPPAAYGAVPQMGYGAAPAGYGAPPAGYPVPAASSAYASGPYACGWTVETDARNGARFYRDMASGRTSWTWPPS